MNEQGQIIAKRDAAVRARRLAAGLLNRDEVYRRMLMFAAALDAEADALEQRTESVAAPQVTQIQMQVQQGPQIDGQNDDQEKP